MANNITKIWEIMGINAANGTGTYKNRMGLSNAITRDNGIPLDLSSFHATYNDAVVYAATSSIAYVDQVITAEGMVYIITEESQGKVTIGQYRDSLTGKIINNGNKEYDIYIKPVGIIPTGDNASIVVNGEGLIKLFAFDDAEADTVPVKENGKLVWKTLTDIGAKDGNTTYEFVLNNNGTGVIITPFFNGKPIYDGENQTKYEIDLDVYTKGEIDTKVKELADLIGKPSEGQQKALYELIAAEVARASEVELGLSNRIGYQAVGNTPASGVYAYIDGVVDSIVNGVDTGKIDSLKDVITWVEGHPLIVNGFDERITANTNAIAALIDRVDNLTPPSDVPGGEENVIVGVRVNGVDQPIVDKIVEISISTGGVYDLPVATKELLGGVKIDDETIKMNEDKQIYVSEVSTDALVQGDSTLVLNGGNEEMFTA